MSQVLTYLLSFAVIASFVIASGGVYILVKRPDDRRRGLLMIGVAIVTMINVWLLSAPVP